MLRLEAKTRLTQEEAMNHIMDFFRKHRMTVVSQSPGCASFEGGGGGIDVEVTSKDDITTIDLLSREWDRQVQDFVELLPKRVRV
jgi:hypothetical protein